MRKYVAVLILWFLPLLLEGQAPYALAPDARPQFFTSTGTILSGGLLYTYLAGTTTNSATYKDSSGSQQHTNPIVMDSTGHPPAGIYLGAHAYKFVLKNSAEVVQWTQDNVYDYAQLLYLAMATSITTGTLTTDILDITGPGSYCGNNASSSNGVVLRCDNLWTNPDISTTSVETRGLSMVVRQIQTHFPETLAADQIAVTGATVIETGTTTGTVTGESVGVRAENYLLQPTIGAYVVTNVVGFQSTLPAFGSNTSITNYYGYYASDPCRSTGGCIQGGAYGGHITGNAFAIGIEGITSDVATGERGAIYINAEGLDGRIKWHNNDLRENQDANNVYVSILAGGPLQVGGQGQVAQLRLPYQASAPNITGFGIGELHPRTSDGHLIYCDDTATCVDLSAGGGGGGGGITTLTVGNLSPVFTSSVATPMGPTAAVTYALSSAAAYSSLTNGTNSAAAPTYYASAIPVTKTNDYTAVCGTDFKGWILLSNAGSKTLTLPATVCATGWYVDVQADNSGGTWAVSRNGHNIDGAASNISLAPLAGVRIASDGSNWFSMRGAAATGASVCSSPQCWLLGSAPNTGLNTAGANSYIGNLDNFGMGFVTNGTTNNFSAMFITNGNNPFVGIGSGLTSPSRKLHVKDATNQIIARFEGPASGGTGGAIEFYESSTVTAQMTWASGLIFATAASTTNPIDFYTNGGFDARFNSSHQFLVGQSTALSGATKQEITYDGGSGVGLFVASTTNTCPSNLCSQIVLGTVSTGYVTFEAYSALAQIVTNSIPITITGTQSGTVGGVNLNSGSAKFEVGYDPSGGTGSGARIETGNVNCGSGASTCIGGWFATGAFHLTSYDFAHLPALAPGDSVWCSDCVQPSSGSITCTATGSPQYGAIATGNFVGTKICR